jgi:hypothetical protein
MAEPIRPVPRTAVVGALIDGGDRCSRGIVLIRVGDEQLV